VRIAKPFVLTFIGLRARGLTIFAALAQAVRHHLHTRRK
jgi:hypothetical protein